MAWYPLPQSGSIPPPSTVGSDEFLLDDQIQSAGWPLWSFLDSADDDHDTPSAGAVRAEKHGNDDTASSDGRRQADDGGLVPQQQQTTQPTDDIFMSQLSAEEMRKMGDDAPFEALDMFPGSMHRLLSYEDVVLTDGSGSEDATLTLGVDTMDTCGFPLFSHDLQNSPPAVPDLLLTPKDQQAVVTKRSRSVAADDQGSVFLEAMVIQELQDVVFQLTKRTRVCFRDAFFRLAESSRAAKCSAANGASETGVHQADGRMSSTPGGCPERETNAIDRTVADLAMNMNKPPRPVVPPLQVLVSRCADGDDSAAEAQSAASWTTTL